MFCVGLILGFQFPSPNGARAQYRVVHLGKPCNTVGSETGAVRLGDTVLAYATMPPSVQTGSEFQFHHAVMQLQQVRLARDGKMARPKPNRWGLNNRKDHTGNLAVDPVNHDLYFTRGDVETLRCDIWRAAARKRRGWEKPAKLRGPVNDRQYTATHPTVGRLADSTVILYFASDRPGGMGGMDIWYTLVHDGTASEPVNLGPQVNSAHDEYTPYYDQPNGILYFSSDRPGGKGGFDIYCAVGQRNTWQLAEAVCGCLNSPQNDLYFIVTDHDSASGFPTGGYLSSNRADSYFLNDSMCCNDLYRWEILPPDTSPVRRVEPADTIDTSLLSGEGLGVRPFMFPLYLYFHNDEPDPKSRDSVTTANYADCQRRYAQLRGTYMAHQPTAEDSAEMQRFFDSCVVGNYERVQELFDHIEAQLDEGKRVVLTVSGYASPLFTDDYNHLLSARRIGSLVNMIRAWRGGLFADALADGHLRIVQQPRGVDRLSPSASRLSPSNDPVYSLRAAIARRIEILNCEIF